MGGSPNVAPPYLIESENPDRETFSTKDDMYQDLDTQEYRNWISNRNSPPIDPELEEMDEENGSDKAHYEEPNQNAKSADADSEIEDDTDTLTSVSSLVEKAQLFRSAIKTASNLSPSLNNGIYFY